MIKTRTRTLVCLNCEFSIWQWCREDTPEVCEGCQQPGEWRVADSGEETHSDRTILHDHAYRVLHGEGKP